MPHAPSTIGNSRWGFSSPYFLSHNPSAYPWGLPSFLGPPTEPRHLHLRAELLTLSSLASLPPGLHVFSPAQTIKKLVAWRDSLACRMSWNGDMWNEGGPSFSCPHMFCPRACAGRQGRWARSQPLLSLGLETQTNSTNCRLQGWGPRGALASGCLGASQ